MIAGIFHRVYITKPVCTSPSSCRWNRMLLPSDSPEFLRWAVGRPAPPSPLLAACESGWTWSARSSAWSWHRLSLGAAASDGYSVPACPRRPGPSRPSRSAVRPPPAEEAGGRQSVTREQKEALFVHQTKKMRCTHTCFAIESFLLRMSICSSTERIFLRASSSAIFLPSLLSLSSSSRSLCRSSSPCNQYC